MNPIDERIEGKLLELHTAFLGQVVAVSGQEASVQPLNLIRQAGREARKQAVVTGVPILRHVGKLVLYEAGDEVAVEGAAVGDHGEHTHAVTVKPHGGHVRIAPIGPGDIVFCVCADRDISQTVEGRFAAPAPGRHQLQDAVIVGVLP